MSKPAQWGIYDTTDGVWMTPEEALRALEKGKLQ